MSLTGLESPTFTKRVSPKADYRHSRYFYWHESVDENPDLEKIGPYLSILISSVANGKTLMWLSSTNMSIRDTWPRLRLVLIHVRHTYLKWLSHKSYIISLLIFIFYILIIVHVVNMDTVHAFYSRMSHSMRHDSATFMSCPLTNEGVFTLTLQFHI